MGIGFYQRSYCAKGMIMERNEIVTPSGTRVVLASKGNQYNYYAPVPVHFLERCTLYNLRSTTEGKKNNKG